MDKKEKFAEEKLSDLLDSLLDLCHEKNSLIFRRKIESLVKEYTDNTDRHGEHRCEDTAIVCEFRNFLDVNKYNEELFKTCSVIREILND